MDYDLHVIYTNLIQTRQGETLQHLMDLPSGNKKDAKISNLTMK